MFDRFKSLGHYTVVGGYDQHCNVGNLRTACTHLGKSCMTGSVDKCEQMTVFFDLIRTDALCNTTGFGVNHAGAAYSVEQRSFSVVYMTENCNYRGTKHRVFLGHIFVDADLDSRSAFFTIFWL